MNEQIIWYALVRFEDTEKHPSFPVEGYPITIHADKKWIERQADGKQWKVVPVTPFIESKHVENLEKSE